VVISIPKVHLQASATSAQVGQAITFDASQVQLDPGDQITKYVWNFGDQTPVQTTTSSTITHRYAKPGHYHMQVQAIDAQNVPGTATVDVTIQAAQSASRSSLGSFAAIGLGLLVILGLAALFLSPVWRRKPSPATQGYGTSRRRTASQQGTPGRAATPEQRTMPRQPSTSQPSGMRPATGSRGLPQQRPPMPGPAAPHSTTRPPIQRAERSMPGRDEELPGQPYKDGRFPQR